LRREAADTRGRIQDGSLSRLRLQRALDIGITGVSALLPQNVEPVAQQTAEDQIGASLFGDLGAALFAARSRLDAAT
jgi:hypothetical protein